MTTRPELLKKWAPILESTSAPSFKDDYRKQVTAQLLENQERAMQEGAQALNEIANVGGTGIALGQAGTNANMAGYDPVLIAMVRRAAPQMIAYDICGVQPMTQPTGLIFAMKSKYSTQGGTEALFNEADSGFSGTGTQTSPLAGDTLGSQTYGGGLSTATAEDLGAGTAFGQMAFSIERTSVTAKTRALRAECCSRRGHARPGHRRLPRLRARGRLRRRSSGGGNRMTGTTRRQLIQRAALGGAAALSLPSLAGAARLAPAADLVDWISASRLGRESGDGKRSRCSAVWGPIARDWAWCSGRGGWRCASFSTRCERAA